MSTGVCSNSSNSGSTLNCINNNKPNKGWCSMVSAVRGRGFVVMACAAVVMLLGTVSSASALDLSVGQYNFYASDFGGSGIEDDNYSVGTGNNVRRGEKWDKSPWSGGGFGAFFDASYLELGVGLTFAGGSPAVVITNDSEKANGLNDTSYSINGTNYSITYLSIGALLKFPISLGESAKFYPAIGFDYLACIAGKPEYSFGTPSESLDYSQPWIKFGVGLDKDLTNELFFRVQALYGIGFASKGVDDAAEDLNEDARGSHGLQIKVGVGIKL